MAFYDILLSVVASFDVYSFAVALIIVGVAWWYVTIPRNLPPGPLISLPILGNILSFNWRGSKEEFKNFCIRCGRIYRMYIGSELFIYLGNYEAIKEAFIKQAEIFSGRPLQAFFFQDEGDKGVLISEGEVWKEHRRFLISTLREFGVGKLSLEPKIMEEIQCLTNEIAKSEGQPQDLRPPINVSVGNVIMALGFGHRYDYDDEKYKQFIKELHESGKIAVRLGIILIFPWLKYIPGLEWFLGKPKLKKIQQKLKQFTKDEIERHKVSYVDGSRKDYIDAFLTERKNIIEKTGSEGTFDMKELEGNLGILYVAGSGTVHITLLWALMYLIIHPDVQEKLQKEIDDVLGLEREPSTSDRVNMPYTEAVLSEITRYSSIVPFNIPHSNIEETTLFGYTIPKRTTILSNLYYAHHDPKHWKDPEVFNPERFINAEGKVTKPEYLIPFSLGKRSCPGESLARMELFLYLTSLFQRFTFKSPDGVTLPEDHYDSVFNRDPKPFKVCAIQRSGYQATQ